MSAERKIQNDEQDLPGTEASSDAFALRQQVAERLAAHRSRRPRADDSEQEDAANQRPSRSRIAATVAERYAQSKSYHAFLAEEAERAVREAEEAARQAEAAAEIAARNAEALAQVQYNLLAELDEYAETSAASSPKGGAPAHPSSRSAAGNQDATEFFDFDAPAVPPPSFTVRLADDLRLPSEAATPSYRGRHPAHTAANAAEENGLVDPSESLFLDEEIAFRQDPIFDPVEPAVEIPGNLIEFPRQLIAARRARPRLAEGPLREEAELHADPSQLRIFEVEAEQISPEPAAETSAPEWTSILLDAHPRAQASYSYSSRAAEHAASASEEYTAPGPEPYAAQHLQYSPETRHLYAAPLAVAPLGLRVMSAVVDGCAVLAGSLIFIAVAVLTAYHFGPGTLSMTAATAALSFTGITVLLGLIYLLLFFTFSDATPGMRYARIGLCTFSDQNPSRAAMRRRLLALALASASLGLGVLWALLDEERLGWHDRISRMYQRSY